MECRFIFVLIIHAILRTDFADARKHHLEVRNDIRPYIALSTFGFYTDGHLDVKLNKLTINNAEENDLFGLSLDKTTIDQMNPYLDSHQNKCILEEPSAIQRSGPILFFLLDLKNLNVRVQCSPEWRNEHIFKSREFYPMYRDKRHSFAKVSDSTIFVQRRRRDVGPQEEDHGLPMEEQDIDDDSVEQPDIPIKEENKMKPSAPIVAVPEVKSPKNVPIAEPNVVAAVPAVKSPNNANAELQHPAVVKPVDSVPAVKSVENAIQAHPHETEAEKAKVPPAPAPPQPEQPYLNGEQKTNNAVQQQLIIAPHSSNEDFKRSPCKNFILPLTKTVVNGVTYYNMSFTMLVKSMLDEGLYNLYFHACPNYKTQKEVSFDVDIEENNNGNFLSAGEMPLPALYFMMSLLFFLSGLFWIFILKKSKHNVYKIHYIMAILVFLKSLSLMFHSINYHFIEIRGEHVEAWAILYYITHLLKGAVLFITIVLIGTGWTFIKHILSDKDKKIFMIVIPLQVLANVAEIIIDESEESDVEFRTWRNIFIFVDLLCCGAILFPIVWSIRHLHEASATDGKAAINLRKLKLFRQFYIMIVCYIYFTRIIVYLLKMTVAFQYAWLDEMFHEMATYVFFVLTGYKFRPAPSHPYFSVPDEDDEEVEVLTGSGLTEGLHRTKALNRNAPPSSTIVIEGNEEERENLITKRESSHEYD